MNEKEYQEQLNQQGHMYKWCLKIIGGYSEAEAQKEVKKLYSYRPPTDEYRWLVFHDDAWHWAMLKLNGEHYWVSNPEFKSPSPEYKLEWNVYEQSNT